MTNKKSTKWLVLSVVVAILLLANVAIGGLLINNKRAAAAAAADRVSGRAMISQMNVGDYIGDFGEFNGHRLTWRIIAKDADGNALIRTDRALPNADGTMFTTKFDDVDKKTTTERDGTFNMYVKYKGSVIDIKNNPESRYNRGTNFWEQTTMRSFLNSTGADGFLSGFSAEEQANMMEKAQKQAVWWGEGQPTGAMDGSSIGPDKNQVPEMSIDADAEPHHRINYLNIKNEHSGVTGNPGQGTVPNPVYTKNPTGNAALEYVSHDINSVANFDTAYGYDITDKVTLTSVDQIRTGNFSGVNAIRNANGEPYSTVLAPDYVVGPGTIGADGTEDGGGRVRTWLRTPMATVYTGYGPWASTGGVYGTAARATTVRGNRNDNREHSAYGEFVDTDGIGVAPTIWLKNTTEFNNSYNATSNIREVSSFKMYTNGTNFYDRADGNYVIDPTDPTNTSNTLTEAQSFVYLKPYIGANSVSLFNHFSKWLGTNGDANWDLIKNQTPIIELAGVGAFPKGLQANFDGEILANSNVQGAVSLINKAETGIENDYVDFTFQVVAKSPETAPEQKTSYANFTIKVAKGDPSATGDFAQLADNQQHSGVGVMGTDATSDLWYDVDGTVDGKGTWNLDSFVGTPEQIVLGSHLGSNYIKSSADYVALPRSSDNDYNKLGEGDPALGNTSEEPNKITQDNDYIFNGVEEAVVYQGTTFEGYGIYGQTLNDKPLPSFRTTDEFGNPLTNQVGIRGKGWTWDEVTFVDDETTPGGVKPEDVSIGKANRSSTYAVAAGVERFQAANAADPSNRHVASYRDINGDFKTIKREVEFVVEQATPTFTEPMLFNADLNAQTWANMQTLLDGQYVVSGVGESADGHFKIDQDTLDSTLDIQGGVIAEGDVEFIPDSNNYAVNNAIVRATNVSEDQIIVKTTMTGWKDSAKYLDNMTAILSSTFQVEGYDQVFSVIPTYILNKPSNVAELAGYGVSFNQGVISATFAKTGTLTMEIGTKVGNTTFAEATITGTVVIGKANMPDSMLPELPADGTLTAVYGQTLQLVVGGLNGWSWVDPNMDVGNATVVGGEGGEAIYNEFQVVYGANNPNYNSVERTVKVSVSKAQQPIPDVTEIPKFTGANAVKFTTKLTFADIQLPENWTWTRPNAVVNGGVYAPEVVAGAVYNSNPSNYTNSGIVEITIELTAPKDPGLGGGAIAAIIIVAVAVVAGAAVAFVLVKKKQATSTKAGSRGNRV